MSYIKIDNIVKKFGDKTVIDGISLEFEKGEFISFLGSSGCGKTTMLRMIAGFEEPTSGSIEIDGKVLYSSKDNIYMPAGKRNLGMVFQSYAVWPHMNLFDNVAYPLKIQKVDKEEIKRRTLEMLEIVGLGGREKEYPWAFSGGQQKRIALARALVMQPSILLLDEPLSNLDAHLREKMKNEIRSIQKKMNIT
ncbi:MAG: ABC transporter ATP-binding protein, partial [Romboutsia sp.]|nr:ABC transporter ATP-binding protein [Romboutsia sp.]